MMNLPELGVGLVYSSALEPLLRESPELIDVLEIEPQTVWVETRERNTPYLVREDVEDHLAGLPGRKLVHSVGTPVGGSIRSHACQMPLLRHTIEKLQAPWASEHLSFNLTRDFFTGFFLPPRQTERGLQVYTAQVQRLRDELGVVPLAIETGVSYLQPRSDEIPDGEFMAAVAQAADCGILLDLHNVYTNQRNGRQTVEAFLSQLPLERVWEIHLAGGFEMDGFWLDAHSRTVPEPLLAISRDVVPQLPNLKAIIFEIFASFLRYIGLESVRVQLARLRELWALRRTGGSHAPGAGSVPRITPKRIGWPPATGKMPWGTWRSAGSLRVPTSRTGRGAGCATHSNTRQGIPSVHGGAGLSLDVPAPDAGADPRLFRAILEDFWAQTPPAQFAASEAEAFGDYLVAKNLRLPQLQNILALKRATVRTLADGQPRVVRFNVDPLPMLRVLAEGWLLENPGQSGEYEIEVTPEGPLTASPAA